LQERSLIGLEARAADGSEVGRIADLVEDEESGEVTHVVVETERGEWLEVPIMDLSLDPDADFATFEADASDEEPGDHTGDEAEPEDYYAPDDEDEEDFEHEGQLVTEPEDGHDPSSEEDLEAREDWEDHSYTPDSDTGDEEIDPLLEENDDVKDDVEDLLDSTGLKVRSVREGVVELTGTAATQDDLEETVREIMGLDEVLEVDTTDVEVR
jgi:sporulation protein YlmC with PRC-barrel domain